MKYAELEEKVGPFMVRRNHDNFIQNHSAAFFKIKITELVENNLCSCVKQIFPYFI